MHHDPRQLESQLTDLLTGRRHATGRPHGFLGRDGPRQPEPDQLALPVVEEGHRLRLRDLGAVREVGADGDLRVDGAIRIYDCDAEGGEGQRHSWSLQGSVVHDDAGSDAMLDARQHRVDPGSTFVREIGQGLYGFEMAHGVRVDAQDNIWTVGRPKHVVMKFDAAKEKWSTYPTPSQPSGTRRIGVDNKGKVWFTEYSIGKLGYLDPDTGQITEYQPQYKWGGYYEAWPDNRGSVWVTDDTYNALIRFDVQTKKFTYYPLPQVRWSVPKVEIDKDGSVWFGSRGIQSIVAVNFKPKGNALKTYRPPERGGFGQSPIAD